MVAQARDAYPTLTFEQADVRSYTADRPFDAVFSNAALHWIPGEDHDAVLSTVADALTESGRFVAEFGGQGNVAAITDALIAERMCGATTPVVRGTFRVSASTRRESKRTGSLRSHGYSTDRRRSTAVTRGSGTGLRCSATNSSPVSTTASSVMLSAVEDRLRPTLFDGDTGSLTATAAARRGR